MHHQTCWTGIWFSVIVDGFSIINTPPPWWAPGWLPPLTPWPMVDEKWFRPGINICTHKCSTKSETTQINTHTGANSNIHDSYSKRDQFLSVWIYPCCSHGTRVFPCFTSRKMDWVFHHRINQDIEGVSLLLGSICLVKCKQNQDGTPLWIWHFTLIRHQAHFHWNAMKHITYIATWDCFAVLWHLDISSMTPILHPKVSTILSDTILWWSRWRSCTISFQTLLTCWSLTVLRSLGANVSWLPFLWATKKQWNVVLRFLDCLPQQTDVVFFATASKKHDSIYYSPGLLPGQ